MVRRAETGDGGRTAQLWRALCAFSLRLWQPSLPNGGKGRVDGWCSGAGPRLRYEIKGRQDTNPVTYRRYEAGKKASCSDRLTSLGAHGQSLDGGRNASLILDGGPKRCINTDSGTDSVVGTVTQGGEARNISARGFAVPAADLLDPEGTRPCSTAPYREMSRTASRSAS